MKRKSVALAVIPTERIDRSILVVRGEKVLLDRDLARLYAVDTKTLNRAVKRNLERFPADFMFRLSRKEANAVRDQHGSSNSGTNHGGRRSLPCAFTEHGAIMAATLLNSPRAVVMSLMIVRAFVRLRKLLATHVELTRRLEALEKRYDSQFKCVFDAIRSLMEPADQPDTQRRKIGFRHKRASDVMARKGRRPWVSTLRLRRRET